jgi:hypothetical protein
MKACQAGVAAGALFAPVSFLLAAVVAGGPVALSRSPVGLAVVAVSIGVAGISTGWISTRLRSQGDSRTAPAVIAGFVTGVLTLAVIGIAVLVAAVIYFENSHFTW